MRQELFCFLLLIDIFCKMITINVISDCKYIYFLNSHIKRFDGIDLRITCVNIIFESFYLEMLKYKPNLYPSMNGTYLTHQQFRLFFFIDCSSYIGQIKKIRTI